MKIVSQFLFKSGSWWVTREKIQTQAVCALKPLYFISLPTPRKMSPEQNYKFGLIYLQELILFCLLPCPFQPLISFITLRVLSRNSPTSLCLFSNRETFQTKHTIFWVMISQVSCHVSADECNEMDHFFFFFFWLTISIPLFLLS